MGGLTGAPHEAFRAKIFWLIRCILATSTCLCIFTIPAEAKCGFNETPDIADVSRIIITNTGCGSTEAPGPHVSLPCSKYWAGPDQKALVDTTVSTVSVWYCSAFKAIKAYTSSPEAPAEAESQALLNDFNALIIRSVKKKDADLPQKLFDVFDPWY